MALGWLDLQQYLELNREAESDRQNREAVEDEEERQKARGLALREGNFVPYTQFLANRQARQTGAAENAADRLLRGNRSGETEFVGAETLEALNEKRNAQLAWDEASKKQAAEINKRNREQEEARKAARQKSKDLYDYITRGGKYGQVYRQYGDASSKSWNAMNAQPTKRGSYKIRQISDEEREAEIGLRETTTPVTNEDINKRIAELKKQQEGLD